ncbi:hypothetical protein ACP4OV_010719 [Aristida adscensionis]
MAAARLLARNLLQLLQGKTIATATATAGLLSATGAAASASTGEAEAAAYPWPHDGARGGQEAFVQSNCALCHSMLPAAASVLVAYAALLANSP